MTPLLPTLVVALQLGGGPTLGPTAPGGAPGVRGSSGGSAVDQIERSVRQPLPPLPPAPASRVEQVWVPDRFLPAPTGGPLSVPGHWEQRLSATEYAVPPLTVCDSTTGQCATTPASVKPSPEIRREP